MTAGAIQLRGATAADIGAVMAIMGKAFEPAFGEAWTAAQCLTMLGSPGVWLALAESKGEPVGFALGRVVVDEGELLLLGVIPAFRRHGAGAALLAFSRRAAVALGAVRLHLEMRDNNPALSFYRSHGLQAVGRRPSYYACAGGERRDAITMSCALLDQS